MVATKRNTDNGGLSKLSKAELLDRLERLEALLSDEKREIIDSKESRDIKPDEYIRVMSLCPIQLNLSTQQYGKGNTFRFKQFGEIKRILYSDLVRILEVHQNFLENGFFYIMDEDVIRKHGLDDLYASILDKNKIQLVLDGDKSNAVEIFKSANKKQQEFIVDILVGKVRDNEPVDLNVLDQISRIYAEIINDEDFNIKKMGEEAKKYLK